MIISGMTACGKTHYLLKMLEENFKGHFDFIYIVCPALRENETYRNWEFLRDPDVFAIPCEHDDVEDFLTMIVGHAKGTKSLIILDDCAFTQTVKKSRTGELVKLAFHGRHIRISTIVITQQLTSIAKAYRDNISKIVFFYCARKDDLKNIFENYLHVDKEEKKILEELKNKKYARLEILTVHPYTHKVVVP